MHFYYVRWTLKSKPDCDYHGKFRTRLPLANFIWELDMAKMFAFSVRDFTDKQHMDTAYGLHVAYRKTGRLPKWKTKWN